MCIPVLLHRHLRKSPGFLHDAPVDTAYAQKLRHCWQGQVRSRVAPCTGKASLTSHSKAAACKLQTTTSWRCTWNESTVATCTPVSGLALTQCSGLLTAELAPGAGLPATACLAADCSRPSTIATCANHSCCDATPSCVLASSTPFTW